MCHLTKWPMLFKFSSNKADCQMRSHEIFSWRRQRQWDQKWIFSQLGNYTNIFVSNVVWCYNNLNSKTIKYYKYFGHFTKDYRTYNRLDLFKRQTNTSLVKNLGNFWSHLATFETSFSTFSSHTVTEQLRQKKSKTNSFK